MMRTRLSALSLLVLLAAGCGSSSDSAPDNTGPSAMEACLRDWDRQMTCGATLASRDTYIATCEPKEACTQKISDPLAYGAITDCYATHKPCGEEVLGCLILGMETGGKDPAKLKLNQQCTARWKECSSSFDADFCMDALLTNEWYRGQFSICLLKDCAEISACLKNIRPTACPEEAAKDQDKG